MFFYDKFFCFNRSFEQSAKKIEYVIKSGIIKNNIEFKT